MIFFWNRKIIYIGNTTETIREIVGILKGNKIKFKHKSVKPNSATNFGSGATTFGGDNINLNFYFIYVHKRDYEKTAVLLKDIVDVRNI